MPAHKPSPEHLKRFLRLLGITRREPSYDALTELVTAYITTVPFENVSKLYYRKNGLRKLPDLQQYLDGIELYNFGGTCYSNNYYLHLLLVHLGYDARLCGADMSCPDVHMINIVSVDGREYIVDAGYAAPFLEPLPRDLNHDFEIALGRDRHVLRPQDDDGRSRMDLYRDGQLKHGYTANPVHRSIDHFAGHIEESYRDGSTFVNALLLVRFFPNRLLAIYNLSLIEAEGMKFRKYPIAGLDEIPRLVEEYFAIPKEITVEALDELGGLGDVWS